MIGRWLYELLVNTLELFVDDGDRCQCISSGTVFRVNNYQSRNRWRRSLRGRQNRIAQAEGMATFGSSPGRWSSCSAISSSVLPCSSPSSSVTLTMPWPCYSKSEIPRQKNNFFGERRIPHSFTCRVDFYRRHSRRNFLMICIYCHFLGSSGALPVVPITYLDHTCNKYCDLIGSLRVTIFIKKPYKKPCKSMYLP